MKEKGITQSKSGVIQISSQAGDVVRITPYAAHVLSWKTPDSIEQLFLSPKAEFNQGAAIRGGVPVIFPQFAGLGSLPKHGFARNQNWQISKHQEDEVTMSLMDNEQTLAIWPYQFKLDYRILISARELSLDLSVQNTGDVPFSFTSALHTYFRVNDSSTACVTGLQGHFYRDSADGDAVKREEHESVTFPSEVDRIYQEVPETITLFDGGRKIQVSAVSRIAGRQRGFQDAVIWNPGPEKCARLADMQSNGYLQFVCIESAAAAKTVVLQPGNNWFGSQNIRVTGN